MDRESIANQFVKKAFYSLFTSRKADGYVCTHRHLTFIKKAAKKVS